MYNSEKYIRTCLDSLVKQDLCIDDYEIIIINDGSSDNSEEIVKEYMKQYPQISLYSQENGGQSKARNKGISLARGQYVCFVDSDDFILEKSLGRVVEEALKLNLEILTYNFYSGDVETIKQTAYHSTYQIEKIQTGIQFIEQHNYFNYAWNYLLLRSFLLDNNLKFVEGKFCEDGMFTMQSFLCAQKVAALDAYVYCYVIRPNSTMTRTDLSHQLKMIEDYQYVIFFLTDLITVYQSKMTLGCYNRCISRRNSYIFFLLIRLLKAKLKGDKITSVLNRLQRKGVYPYKFVLDTEYGDWRYTLIHRIINNKYLYKTTCFLYRILN